MINNNEHNEHNKEENNKKNNGEEANIFAKSRLMARSPNAVPSTSRSSTSTTMRPESSGGIELTPRLLSKLKEDRETSPFKKMTQRVDKLYKFVKDKKNINKHVGQQLRSLQLDILEAKRSHEHLLRSHLWMTENMERMDQYLSDHSPTPASKEKAGKRDRESPGETEDPKTKKQFVDNRRLVQVLQPTTPDTDDVLLNPFAMTEPDEDQPSEQVQDQVGQDQPSDLEQVQEVQALQTQTQQSDQVEQNQAQQNANDGVEKNEGWNTVENKKEKKKKKKKKANKNMPNKGAEEKSDKPKARRNRHKGDAILVARKDDLTSYASILRKMREDPSLKSLGENVVKTRRTQREELLFELKKDPSGNSSVFKELIEKSLGEIVKVRTLSHDSVTQVIECRNLDELTTAKEVESALKALDGLSDVPLSIRLRKAHGGMQTASIRLPSTAANELLKIGRLRVGWAMGQLRSIPRIEKHLERCFRCLNYGHQAKSCKGPDRSDLCRNCGQHGHISIDCKEKPRCLLCPKDGNHATGSLNCPAYKKAKEGRK